MKSVTVLTLFTVLALSAFAQDNSDAENQHHNPPPADPHAGHGVSGSPETGSPAEAPDPHGDHQVMQMPSDPHPDPAMTMSQPTIDPDDAEYYPYNLRTMGGGLFWMLLFDQLEFRLNDSDDYFRWDAEGWYGSDWNRFWFKTEGEQTVQGSSAGRAEIHGYYSRLIAPFWDAQVGVRYDQQWESGSNDSRVFGAIGVEGLAPYRYEVTPTLFVSGDGDVSFRLTATKDFRITQRLIAQPRFETEIAVQAVPQFGVGSGFNYVELGLRLRYEIYREFAPYVGIEWERQLGQTASLASEAGEDPDVLSFVVGVRIWF